MAITRWINELGFCGAGSLRQDQSGDALAVTEETPLGQGVRDDTVARGRLQAGENEFPLNLVSVSAEPAEGQAGPAVALGWFIFPTESGSWSPRVKAPSAELFMKSCIFIRFRRLGVIFLLYVKREAEHVSHANMWCARGHLEGWIKILIEF